jgi:threonine dehydrogenase-like Zn-dependent dehydrogenase
MTPEHPSEFNPWTRREIISLFFDYLMQGRMKVSDLVTHRYAPSEAPQVYAALRDRRSEFMGVLFDWTGL